MKLHAPSNRNTSLEKASRILFAFDEETSQLGVMDIARRVGLNKSTVSRFVSSLTDLGLLELERAGGGRESVRLELGRRFPAATSSAGQVLLAGADLDDAGPVVSTFEFAQAENEDDRALKAIRSIGYATEVGQMIDGVSSVAAPILDRSGSPVAALAVLTNRGHAGEPIPAKLVETVTSAAAEVSGKLGYYRARKGERRNERQPRSLRAEAG